jgi:hypothetical protein
MQSISLSLITSGYVILDATFISGHDAVIEVIYDKDGVIVIHEAASMEMTLRDSSRIHVTTHNGDVMLCPTYIQID